MNEVSSFLEWVKAKGADEEGVIEDLVEKWVKESGGKLTVAEPLECSEESEGLEGLEDLKGLKDLDCSNVVEVLGIREPLKRWKVFENLIEGKEAVYDNRKRLIFQRLEDDSWFRRVYEKENEVFFEKSNGWWYKRELDKAGNTVLLETSGIVRDLR
jgi:hypothetical protein